MASGIIHLIMHTLHLMAYLCEWFMSLTTSTPQGVPPSQPTPHMSQLYLLPFLRRYDEASF